MAEAIHVQRVTAVPLIFTPAEKEPAQTSQTK